MRAVLALCFFKALLLSRSFRSVWIPGRVSSAYVLLALLGLREERRVVVCLGSLEAGLTCISCANI